MNERCHMHPQRRDFTSHFLFSSPSTLGRFPRRLSSRRINFSSHQLLSSFHPRPAPSPTSTSASTLANCHSKLRQQTRAHTHSHSKPHTRHSHSPSPSALIPTPRNTTALNAHSSLPHQRSNELKHDGQPRQRQCFARPNPPSQPPSRYQIILLINHKRSEPSELRSNHSGPG